MCHKVCNGIETRVEKHVIRCSDPYYDMLREYCHLSKNLYNHANYLVRQQFFQDGSYLSYETLDKLLKRDLQFPDYRNMPTAKLAQQTLRMLDANWKSYFASIKDWMVHPEKYLGKPKIPGYLRKDGFYALVFTNQACRINDIGIIRFPKVFKGFTVKSKIQENSNFVSFQQVRVVPYKHRITLECVYYIRIADALSFNNRIASIDIGVDRLAAVTNNVGVPAFAINGRPLKSMNQYYNKTLARLKSKNDKAGGNPHTKRMDALTAKRQHKILDYMHKSSRKIVDFCLEYQISTLVIGKNDLWKQNADMGKVQNQTFVQLPFAIFIDMIEYKARTHGITVILIEESYTSGTSFIDGEAPVKANYNKQRRVHRGLFRSNQGLYIHADLNGSYQIMNKVFPVKWNRGCVLHPTIVNIA